MNLTARIATIFSRTGVSSLARLGLLAALAALTLFAAPAGAALLPAYGPLGTYDPGPGAHLAVDDTTGNILFAQGSRVLVLAPDLTPGSTAVASVLTEFAVHGPNGIAVDQSTGAVYVTTVAGNEVQYVNFAKAAAGTFTLSFKGQSTPPIPHGSDPSVVQSALEALSTIGAGNVNVVGGGPAGGSRTVTFQGALAKTDLPQLSVDGSALQPPPPAINVEALAPGVQNVQPANADGGTFTLSFEGQTTAPIAYGADEPTVQAALEALSTIGAGNVEVTPGNPYTVTFKGPLTETAVQLSGNASGLQALTPAASTQTASAGAPDGILRYLSDGAPVPTYTVDPTFPSPTLNTYGGPLAVDPTSHDLLVADTDHVNRYSSAGVLLDSFDGSDSPEGKFTAIRDIAVGASSTYVLNLTGNYIEPNELGRPVASRLAQFDDQGVYQRTLVGGEVPVAITVDAHDRLVAVGRAAWHDSNLQLLAGAQLFTFGVDGAVESIGTIAGGPHYIWGLAADGGASARVYASTAAFFGGNDGITALLPGPGLHIDPPLNPEAESVHLTGLVNPQGNPTTAHFEYCAHRDPCATNTFLPWTSSAPDTDVGVGSADEPVAADIAGLLPHTTYSLRLTATDTQTSVSSAPLNFTTTDVPPVVSTGLVSDLSQTTATVNGTVDPRGIQTTYYFEYGESAAYGSRVPSEGSGVVGNGYEPRLVGRQILGLAPGTTYHYRIVAINSAGTTQGADRTFTTEAAGLLVRAYEMVSPVEKQGVPVSAYFHGVRASADGNALMYGTDHSVLPGAESAPLLPRVFAARSAEGWESTPIELPFNGTSLGSIVAGVSSDARSALVYSTKKLTPDAVESGNNLYIRTPGAQAPAQELTLVASDPLLGLITAQDAPLRIVGSSGDLRTFVFTSSSTGVGPIYLAAVRAGVRLISRLPDGTPASGVALGPTPTDSNQVSADGSRIYFNLNSAGTVGLYLRENASAPEESASGACDEPGKACTKAISISQRPGDPSTTVGAELLGASPDGRYVEFRSASQLTVGAPDGGGVYRYDVVSGDLNFVGAGGCNQINSVPRPAVNAIFCGLSYLHDGVVTPISDVPGASAGLTRASANGRYAVFISGSNLTSDDNADHGGLYRYDTLTDDLVCVSCRTDGGVPRGGVQIGTLVDASSFLSHYKPNVVTDEGAVFFDTLDPLVGADTNGTRDVYAYENGRPRLISRGKYPTTSTFMEATPDGSNVYFVTNEQLAGRDHDTTADMYDARVGGGIPELPPDECLRDDCKATPNAGPELPFGGSEALSGPGNLKAAAKKRCPKGRHRVKSHGKTRCAKQNKQGKENRKQANSNRRQGR